MSGASVFRDKGSNSSYGPRDPGEISTRSIGRYRDVLSPREIAFIQLVAGSEMAVFGYERDSTRLGAAGRVRFAVGDVPLGSAHLLAWHAREAIRDRRGRPVPGYRLVGGERAA
jgi:hypothetical protein